MITQAAVPYATDVHCLWCFPSHQFRQPMIHSSWFKERSENFSLYPFLLPMFSECDYSLILIEVLLYPLALIMQFHQRPAWRLDMKTQSLASDYKYLISMLKETYYYSLFKHLDFCLSAPLVCCDPSTLCFVTLLTFFMLKKATLHIY